MIRQHAPQIVQLLPNNESEILQDCVPNSHEATQILIEEVYVEIVKPTVITVADK
jgi:hypothetical protein